VKRNSKRPTRNNQSSIQVAVQDFHHGLGQIIRSLFDSSVNGPQRPAHGSVQYRPGEFLTPARVSRASEIDTPSVFMPWDDPDEIDWARIPPVASLSMGAAIALGEILKTGSRFQAEWELIVVIDLSRSMLSAPFPLKKGVLGRDGMETKLGALFKSVGAFIHVAEAAGFILRTLYLAGGGVAFEERVLRPKAYALRAMILMRDYLTEALSIVQEEPETTEHFCLGKGIQQAMRVKSQSFIIVISDFLDPIDDGNLKRIMAEAMKRHKVHLVDIAARQDRDFPPPEGWQNWEARRVDLPFGPRHLELGCEERPISPSETKEWNSARQDDRDTLEGLAKRLNARWYNFGQGDGKSRSPWKDYPTILSEAMSAFVK
jgi:hypothetical protein